jgi:hypothetical protein
MLLGAPERRLSVLGILSRPSHERHGPAPSANTLRPVPRVVHTPSLLPGDPV